MVRPLKAGRLVAITALLLQSAACGGTAADTPRNSDAAVRNLVLSPERIKLLDGSYAVAERGFLAVPANRADPQSALIDVEVYRFRAQQPAGVPPIFELHGGPGFRGLGGWLATPGHYERAIQPFTRIADLVVVSQRGIGPSRPNTTCEGPTDLDSISRTSAQCRSHWESRGVDLRGFTVVEAAHDVADAAKTLGYSTITLWGASFGSHWAITVMRYHPHLVARAVLSAVEGADHTYDSPTGILNALRRIAAAAESSAQYRDRVPAGGLIAALQTVIARAEREPITVSVPHPVTRRSTIVRFTAEDVRQLATGYTDGASSRYGIRWWPADILRLYHGDFTNAAIARLKRASRPETTTASFFMLDCSSGISAQRLAALQRDPARHTVGDQVRWYRTACAAWDADLGDTFRQNFQSDVPTVIIQGTWDVHTPWENAVDLAPFFTRGTLVTVFGGSHEVLYEDRAAAAADAGPGDPTEGRVLAAELEEFLRTGDRSVFPDSVMLPPVRWAVSAPVRPSGQRGR